MKIQAVKYVLSKERQELIQTFVPSDRVQDIENMRNGILPIVYLICLEDIEALEKFTDSIVRLGKKNAHKGLAHYLLGRKKMPVIDGNYTRSAQVKRSIKSLLTRAEKQSDLNVFFIGMENVIFTELWNRAKPESDVEAGKSVPLTSPVFDPGNLKDSSPPRSLTQQHETFKPFNRGQPLQDPEIMTSWLLNELGSQCEVPMELARRFVGNSKEALLVRQLVISASRSETPVLIMGETGTGKEVVARQIHNYSVRKNRKFIPVNCGAIPGELFESELFGHEKGAFSGAVNSKKGLWEIAGNGTLFLDEIGDLDPNHQVKILRSLESSTIRRVGSDSEIRTTPRVLAATNRDLFSMVQAGKFREDLYYRLRGFFIHTPALRDHPDDIPALVQLFWGQVSQGADPLPDSIIRVLKSAKWPGNARELKMVLNNLRTLFGFNNLREDHIHAIFLIEGRSFSAGTQSPISENELTLHRAECLRHLKRVYETVHAMDHCLRRVIHHESEKDDVSETPLDSFRFRFQELKILADHPLKFHSEHAFSSVYGLKGKITYLSGLIQNDHDQARHYWKMEVEQAFRSVMQTLFKEIEQVMGIHVND